MKSLKGRLEGRKMGDLVTRSRPTELMEKMKKRRQVVQEEDEKVVRFKKQQGPSSVLAAASEILEQGAYRPRTKETQHAYEELLSFVQHHIGTQPREVLASGADEVIAILKDESRNDREKKAAVEDLLSSLSDKRFHKLVEIGKRITDYHDSGASTDAVLDENIPVVFEDDEDQGDNFVVRDDSDDSDDGVEADAGTTLAGSSVKDEGMDVDSGSLPAAQVDAYWLQRQVSTFISEPDRARDVAERIFSIMSEGDATTCENKLVELLEFDQFDFVRLLMHNRDTVVWATRYRRAKDDAERKSIETQMAARDNLLPILDQLLGRAKGAKKTGDDASRATPMDTSPDESNVPSHWRIARKVLDLEALSFQEGGHFMANKKLVLPKGTQRIPHKGYEEVLVPAPERPPQTEQPKLVPIDSLPPWTHEVFRPKPKPGVKEKAGIQFLNPLQSAVFQKAFFSADNLLIAAPTGSGKTNTAMLCILHEIGLNRRQDGTIDLDAFKIVYIAPMKSLVQEMVLNFGKRLEFLGVKVKELSGDQNLTKQQISETQIIVTTPEKWDVVTRRSGDRTFTQLVRLIIIDEVHLLHDDRGPVLEAIIARTNRQVEETQQMIRLVGLSATLPNYEDVAMLLRVEESGLFHFGSAHRPVPLELSFFGIDAKKAVQRFRVMNEICYEQVMLRAGKHQVIVFVHSRKETAKTARFLRDTAMAQDKLNLFLPDYGLSREVITSMQSTVKNGDLKDLMAFGFGIHHAGMSRDDRTLVEELFDDGHLKVLVSTATLAWGVNLPAHCCIIKGTQVYSPEKGRWIELSGLDVMQMLGRAGRPQYDVKGEGVLITSQSELQFYLSLTNTQLPVESQLISRLPDLVLAEMVLGTVTNVDEAVNWLAYTFLYVCMLRSPSLYGISAEEFKEDPYLERRRADLIHSAAMVLHSGGLINYERQSGSFQVTDLGRVASYYYVTHKSMTTYNENLRSNMSDIDLFRLFCMSSEFKTMSVRTEEKLELEKLLERVPVPVKEREDDPIAKANVLLQAYISRLKLEGFSLMSDMVYVTQSAARLIRALHEIALKRGWASLQKSTLELALMVEHRMWRTQSPLRQFGGAILDDILVRLERRDYPWERMWDLNSQEIGELIRIPAKGKDVHRLVHMFPTLRLTAHVQPVTRSTLRVQLTITPDFNWSDKFHGSSLGFWIIVLDGDEERILYHQYFLLKKKFAVVEDNDHLVDFVVPLQEVIPPQYFIRVVADKWLGSEATLPISLISVIPPSKAPPHDDMLDLRPLPVASSLEKPAFAGLFKGMKTFNPLQTQTFNALYKTNGNVLVSASVGSGIEVCGELAILRALASGGKVVYVNPIVEACCLKKRQWEAKFGVLLEKLVLELTGDTATDLKLLELGHLIISTPENWDRMSRRWKKRKPVQEVDLFLVDNLHLLNAPELGHVLEVVVSRMRFISARVERPIRIVGLSASVANAKELGEWIGASKQHIFNFHPTVRPVPLEVHLQGFDSVHFAPRLLSMTRPMLQLIQRAPADKPLVIFVHAKSQALAIAKDLKAMCDGLDDPSSRFRMIGKEEMQRLLQSGVVKSAVHQTFLLEYGIGIYHEHMTNAEREFLDTIYGSGLITCLIASRETCWAMPFRTHTVLVAGTEYYDGKEHRYIEYPISDVLQMVGLAGRAGDDERGMCALFCYAPRKDFYKHYLFEALPVESQLDSHLHNHLNSEIVTRTITNKQDAVDYITWTFLFRRIAQNPNYYGLSGVSNTHLSDYLSQLVEDTINGLTQAGMVSEENGDRLSPLNPGIISAYYYISFISMDLFMSSLTAKTKMRALLEVLAASSEFDEIPVRRHEAGKLRKLASHLPMKLESTTFSDGRSKINVLLQAHFSRFQLPSDLAEDQKRVVVTAHRLIQSMVDVVSSEGWLVPALAGMELCQMCVQGMWDNDSHLLQLPHLGENALAVAAKMKVESIYDFQELDGKQRAKILEGLTKQQVAQVAAVSNRYPEVELAYAIENENDLTTTDPISVVVQLEREWDESSGALGPVTAPLFPKEQAEGWWLVIGDEKSGTLYGIKRVTFGVKAKEALQFVGPTQPGKYQLKLFLMSDSYVGCDQEFELEFNIRQGDDDDDDDEAEPMDTTK